MLYPKSPAFYGTLSTSVSFRYYALPEIQIQRHVTMNTKETPLAMALSKRNTDERATPLTAFRMARRWWLEGRRLNLSLLAEELGIGRATLMRWVGNKDLLMGEILWSLYKGIYDQAIEKARQDHPERGIDFLGQIYKYVNVALINARPMHD